MKNSLERRRQGAESTDKTWKKSGSSTKKEGAVSKRDGSFFSFHAAEASISLPDPSSFVNPAFEEAKATRKQEKSGVFPDWNGFPPCF